MDIGSFALKNDWYNGDELQKNIIKQLGILCDQTFKSINKEYKNGMKLGYDLDPKLDGYWGDDSV